MYKTKCQVNPIKFIIKVYLNHDTLKCAEFNLNCAEFSATGQVLFQFHNPTCSYNHPYNHHQKFSSAKFQCIIPLLLKIILTIPNDTLFLCASAIPQLPIFTCSPPCNVHQKYFPCFSYLANSDCINGPQSMGVLTGQQDSQLLILYRSGPESWCIVGSTL